MAKRLKRSNTIYFDRTINKFIIDKYEEDLNLSELALLKNNPDKYTIERPYKPKLKEEEKELTDEELELEYEKRQLKIKKKEEKAEEKFWDFYEKYKKNPKKYNKGLTKTERRILKYFNKKSKKEKQKLSKEEKRLKKIKKDFIQYTLYLKQKEEEDAYELKTELKTGIPFKNSKKKKNRFFTCCNPNKAFSNNNRNYDDVQVALLEDIEAEIIDRLNSPEIFTDDLTVIDYSSKDKKKKKTPKDLTRLMI